MPHHRELSRTRKRILTLTRRGLGPTRIAQLTEVSRTRVYQHLERLRADGYLPKRDEQGAA